MVVPGYWENPEADALSFHDGYWKSGDIAARDAEGNIRIRDRKKDVINRGGYKISAPRSRTFCWNTKVSARRRWCPILVRFLASVLMPSSMPAKA